MTYVDITPSNDELRAVGEVAAEVVVLDHHISSRDRYQEDIGLVNAMEALGHRIIFDMDHSGAVLTWKHCFPSDPVPELLLYIQDRDLWQWRLPLSREVTAALDSYPRDYATWDGLAERPTQELAREGEPILRANRVEVERLLQNATPVEIDGQRMEAVNASNLRSSVGHELAKRSAHGVPIGCVYRSVGDRIYATLYSIGEFDVASLATGYGGGGHRNAAGFSVPMREWLEEFL